MKRLMFVVWTVVAVMLSGCATPRGSADEALLATYPASVQRQIIAGEIAVGFDQEQVRLAWGRPDRERTRETAAGREIVWEYTQLRAPRVGVSVGGGTRGGVGGGIGVSTAGQRNVKRRVVFDRQTTLVSEFERFD